MTKSELILFNKELTDAYFNSMNVFVDMCTELTTIQINREKHSSIDLDDVDEIVQYVCYLMLTKSNVTEDSFNSESSRKMVSYVNTIIRECVVRMVWGRNKYGAGYILS